MFRTIRNHYELDPKFKAVRKCSSALRKLFIEFTSQILIFEEYCFDQEMNTNEINWIK